MYAFTVMSIFIDIKKSGKTYLDMVEDDIKKLSELGIKSEDLAADLAIRLKGDVKELTGDD